MVWWLRLSITNAGTMGSVPDWGTKVPYAVWHGLKINENKRTTKCHEKILKEAENAVDTYMHVC